MQIHPVFQLSQSAQRVRQALVGKELDPYYQRPGLLIERSPGRWINWSVNPNGEIEGNISYFRSRSYCAYRFCARVSDNGDHSVVQFESALKGWAIPLFVLAYGIGLAMCIVGVVFPILGQFGYKKGIARCFRNVEAALKAWDEAQSPRRLTTKSPPPIRPLGARDSDAQVVDPND